LKLQARKGQIGIDRLIRLDWLEKAAYLSLAGNDVPDVKTALQGDLKEAFRSKNISYRGSLDKTITILMRIWNRPPKEFECFCKRGLSLLSNLPTIDHVVVHWGMVMAVYPFWGSVAAYVGRLLRLQGKVLTRQIQMRMRESYGERSTVLWATQKVLRSFVDWRVLADTPIKGTYVPSFCLPIENPDLIAWLAEAFLYSQDKESAPLDTILNSPIFFAFRLSYVSSRSLVKASAGRLDWVRQGLNQDLIILKNSKGA
jgi:hypothetical protein